MRTRSIAAYGGALLYPPQLEKHTAAIQRAGWSCVVLGQYHLSVAGDIYFNDTEIVSGGLYMGHPIWPCHLARLISPGVGNSVVELHASVGGAYGASTDFEHIQAIYSKNGNSFEGSALQANFRTLYRVFAAISVIDMAVEETYDQPSFVAFCEMLADIGFGISFRPYAGWERTFWTGALATLERSHPGLVRRWNLPCYDGGVSNDPKEWAGAIKDAIPAFDTSGYILVGDWCRILEGGDSGGQRSRQWYGDSPAAVAKLVAKFSDESCVGGGFVDRLDSILAYPADTQIEPDPQFAPSNTNLEMADYANAIRRGLNGTGASSMAA